MRSAVLTLLVCNALPLVAQTKDSTRLKDLVVTATRSPTPLRSVGSSTDLLRPEELRGRQLTTVREALQLVPGGTVLTTGGPGGVSSLFLRGVSSSQTLLLLDGIRINDADASYGSWLGGAELGGMSRLEIVRGPQSTLYGGAAIGGVVALDAARGSGHPHGDAELGGGSFSTWRGRASAQAGWRGFGLSTSLSANGTDNQRRPNDWNQRTQVVRLDYRVNSRLQAGGTFRGIQSSYTSPGDIRSTNTTPEGTTDLHHHQGTVWLEASPTARWRSRLVLGLGGQNSESSSRFDGGPESVFSLRNTRSVLDWQNSVSADQRLLLIAGVNREWSKAVSDGTRLDQRLWGVYGEAELMPIPELSLTGGIRADDYNTFANAVTFRLTGAWLIEQSNTKLRASYGTGFMPPSLTARFGSAFQNPNPDIRPEHSRGWDAGVDQSLIGGRGNLSATWFHNSLRDLIGFEGADYPALGRSINIDRARTQGLELSGRYATGPVDARVAYTLLSAKSLSEPDSSRRLIRRPRHTVSADVMLSVTPRGTLGGGLVALADRQDEDFNSFPSKRVDPGDYLVARVYGSWSLGALTLQARIENLFNTSYEPVYGFPALGRSFNAALGMRF
jgi:vitamin B12 transporter